MEKLKVFRYSGGSIFDPDNEMVGIAATDEDGRPFFSRRGERVYLDRDALLESMEEEKIKAIKDYIGWSLSLGPVVGAEWITEPIADEIDRHAREIWEFVKREMAK